MVHHHKDRMKTCDAAIQTELSLLGKNIIVLDAEYDNNPSTEIEYKSLVRCEPIEHKHEVVTLCIEYRESWREDDLDQELFESGICKKFRIRLKREEANSARIVTEADVNEIVSPKRSIGDDSAYGSGLS